MQKSIIIDNYIYGTINFLEIRKIKYSELENEKIEIFFNTELDLFYIGYHLGKHVQMQIN